MRKRLTILTEPVNTLYNMRNSIYNIIGREHGYGGHITRTERLITGLYKLGYDDFNYRPKRINEIGEHVHVLSNVRTLRFAIQLKRRGIIKRLTVGPNIAAFADEFDGIVASEEIDLYVLASQWAAEMDMEIEPRLVGRCTGLPYGGIGIDLDKYFPKPYNRDNNVLVYSKNVIDEGIQITYRVCNILKKYGYNPVTISYRGLDNGKYRFEDYLELLNKSKFMVAIGIAEKSANYLTEAWTMDTPTICFDPRCYYWTLPFPRDYVGKGDNKISTCPYLTEYTGARFYEMHELEDILESINEYFDIWRPRQWVLEHMSLENCARLFLQTIGIDI